MKAFLRLSLFALALVTWGNAAETSTNRFTQTLAVAEREEVGLERFTSDQLAVLDALVRRDMSTRLGNGQSPTTTFSQRLTADERRYAGLLLLDPKQLARLDALVERHTSTGIARALLAPPVYVARRAPTEAKRGKSEHEIHGSISLTYGWGAGGYSEKTGAMTVRVDDPAGRYSISAGYSETQLKGGRGLYRDDPFLDRRPPDLSAP